MRHSKSRRRPTAAPPLARPSGSASPRGIRRLFYFIVLRVCLPGQTRFSFLQNAGDVLLSHVRRRCAAIGGLWRPQPTSIYSNLPRPASSPSPPPTRQICRVMGVALNDPKRLNLTLSPPRAAPVGAKSTDGHPPDFRKPDANSTISQSRYGRHQLPLNHDQPSFVSNPRTISTQPSHIRDSPTPTATQPQPNHYSTAT